MSLLQPGWIALVGLRAIEIDPELNAIKDAVLGGPDLSLVATGVYAFVLSHQGQAVNPYEESLEDLAGIATAIEELISPASSFGLDTRQ